MAQRPQIKRYIAAIPSQFDPNYLEIRLFNEMLPESEEWLRRDCADLGFIFEDAVKRVIEHEVDEIGTLFNADKNMLDMSDEEFEATQMLEKIKRELKTDTGFKRLFMYVPHKYDVQDVVNYLQSFGVVNSNSSI